MTFFSSYQHNLMVMANIHNERLSSLEIESVTRI